MFLAYAILLVVALVTVATTVISVIPAIKQCQRLEAYFHSCDKNK